MTLQQKDLHARLDAHLATFNRSDAPGLVIGIARDGRALYRKGFGMTSLEHGVANTPATRMRIGSTSKHFACLAALLLAEDGKLDIDAGVRTYMPELPELAGEPTLRQLMTHTSGYRCYLDLSVMTQGVSTILPGAPLAIELRQRDVNFPPGERMIYCNGGYHLLSQIIGRVSGMSFEQFLEQRIFRVMGMNDTESVSDDLRIRPRMATQHVPDGAGGYLRGLFPCVDVLGEGGIVSTIDDMLTWAGHLRHPDRLGSPDTWREMLTMPRYSSGETGVYALGLMRTRYRNVETIHHAGGVFGGTCQMLTVPSHALDIVLMSNGAPVDPVSLATEIVDIVLGDEVLGPPRQAAASTSANPGLVGQYLSVAPLQFVEIVERDERLHAVLHHQPHLAQPLIALERGYRIEDGAGAQTRVVPHARTAAGDVPSIDFIESGHAVTLNRYEGAPPVEAQGVEGLCGQYSSHDADAHAVISIEDGLPTLSIRGATGGVRYRLSALTRDVWTFEPADASALSTGTALVERRADQATGFSLYTSRTRALAFSRIG
ncbi:serine hydrolase [Pandoraea fibrosis]|uniref:Serine hydrolase n=1 Tax=Pandoraea fibrosis TaxID=1891094 RepID=A0ABX6HM97_9BURK|nr:serine hydrolase domain-containing protein [Pandoraea fibrosis]QHE91189.1 serine hydrolase [Pandoraea fibrosis]QHF12020.1 serine hydrolase [Pandoraea fibrosis]